MTHYYGVKRPIKREPHKGSSFCAKPTWHIMKTFYRRYKKMDLMKTGLIFGVIYLILDYAVIGLAFLVLMVKEHMRKEEEE